MALIRTYTIDDTLSGSEKLLGSNDPGEETINVVIDALSTYIRGETVLTDLGITGTPDGTKFLRDDGSWQDVPGSGVSALADLTDVSTAGTTSGFVLVANGSEYVGRALLSADLPDLSGTYALASHTHVFADIPGLQSALDGKAASSHTHIIGDVTGLQSALDGKTDTGHSHSISDVTNLQSELDSKASTSHTHTTSDITDLSSYTGLDARYYTESEALALFAPIAHTHTTSDITNLSSYTGLDARYYTETEADANFAAASHTHAATEITSGTFDAARYAADTIPATALARTNATLGAPEDGYVAKYDNATGGVTWAAESGGGGGGTWGSITGTLSDQTDLQSALDGKADSSHTHATGDVTSGTFADARIAQSNVTQHQAALSITESQISDLQSYLTSVSLTTNTDVVSATNTNRFVLVANGTTGYVGRALVEADISDLGSYLTSETNDLSASVTWVNVPDANITQSSVTQHQAALNITESQISDLQSYLTSVDIGDINATGTPSASTYLRGDGTWSAAAGGGAGALADLSDVVSATNTNRFALMANGTTGYVGRALVEADISDLQSYLTAETNDLSASVTWVNVPDANITQSSVTQHQAALTITESQISDLQSYLTSVSLTSNTDVVSATNTNRFVLVANGTTGYVGRALVEADISDLGPYLTSESNDLSASVTWVNVPDANITQSSVTQHQAALTITESQISDLGTYAAASHTHVKSDITDLTTGDFSIDATGTVDGTPRILGIANVNSGDEGARFQIGDQYTVWETQFGKGLVGASYNTMYIQGGRETLSDLSFTGSDYDDDGTASVILLNTQADKSVVVQTLQGTPTADVFQIRNSSDTAQLVVDTNFVLKAAGSVDTATIQSGGSNAYVTQDWVNTYFVPLGGGAMTGDLEVPDEAYGVSWNGSSNVPTKNAVYDQIESLSLTESNDLTAAVTWANVPDANITQSSVTQHQSALTITESQISDLQSYLTSVSLTSNTDVVSATNTNGFVLVANGTTGYVGRALVEADISDFGSYSVTSHTHATSAIVSGTFANARIAEGNVTQHQAALSITESQISDFGSYAAASHTHVKADITDFDVDIADINATGTADSTTFLRGDGQWQTPSGGAAGNLIIDVARRSSTTNTSVTSTPTALDWQTELIAGTNITYNGANTTRFTVSETGTYFIGGVFTIESAAQRPQATIDIRVNGTSLDSTVFRGSSYIRNSGISWDYWAIEVANIPVELAANDYVEFFIQQNTTGSYAAGGSATVTLDADKTQAWVYTFRGDTIQEDEIIAIACSDLTSDLTTGTSKGYIRMPFAATVNSVRASVLTAPTGADIEIDINENGTTILGTKLHIDAGEKTSTTAGTAYTLTDTALADDAEITVDIDTVGSTVAGAGLIVYLNVDRA